MYDPSLGDMSEYVKVELFGRGIMYGRIKKKKHISIPITTFL
jgi:hypothetical protein